MYFVPFCEFKKIYKKNKTSISGQDVYPLLGWTQDGGLFQLGAENKAVFKFWVELLCHNNTQRLSVPMSVPIHQS
jgi:hypothetical protein